VKVRWWWPLAFLHCGTRTPLDDYNAQTTTTSDASDAGRDDDGIAETSPCAPPPGDGGCVNLQCKIAACPPSTHTRLSGVVYDPAGKRPLYGAFVYVPNAPLDPIPDGPSCTPCPAVASGKPIVHATTDAKGRFTLVDPPSGDVPLVMQLGKWRRQVTVHVNSCAGNSIDDPSILRFPRNKSEGNIPKIAFSAGPCDFAECFLVNAVGLDKAEITGPAGNGRIHVYQSKGNTFTAPNQNIVGFNAGDPYSLWASASELSHYDVIFNACDCQPNNRAFLGPAYDNMKKYLESGGRLFATHYHYNWFIALSAPADFKMQAPWTPNADRDAGPPFLVDTTHVRGKAFDDWLLGTGVTSKSGEIAVIDTWHDVAGLNGGAAGNGPYKNTTQWIYHPTNQTAYLSFNTPTGADPSKQCGRAVFSDVHVSGLIAWMPFPKMFPDYCPDITPSHTTNEQALEFLFFDLASCVQDDLTPPSPCSD